MDETVIEGMGIAAFDQQFMHADTPSSASSIKTTSSPSHSFGVPLPSPNKTDHNICAINSVLLGGSDDRLRLWEHSMFGPAKTPQGSLLAVYDHGGEDVRVSEN